MYRTMGDREFARFLADMPDDDFATIARHTGMDSTPERTPAGYLAVLEAMAAGSVRVDRGRMAHVMRSLPMGRPGVLALLVLVLRMTKAPALSWAAGPVVRRLVPQAGHGASAPVRGSPGRVLTACPPGATPS
ncbi:hypothetical protein OG693_39905 [Streptomyces sp. NBC_01259]|uniref:hypothetical protein n=1 Tax=Streptomyces sp. NBC_01259 TaxID=2903800 RepID=UPI00325164C6